MIWTQERIEKYKQASDYTSFHKKLSVLLEPYLDKKWTLADIGCGPGLLSICLAPMVAGIDAIDNDSAAIDDLKKRLDDVSLTDSETAEKVRPRLASIEDLGDESWDIVTMCFFGVNEKVLKKLLPLAKRRALIFMHGRPDADGPLASLDDGEKYSAAELEDHLSRENLAFRKSVIEMQFGQPFRNIEDIHDFLADYEERLKSREEGPGGPEITERRVADAEDRIIKTNRFDYPYYLPQSMSVAQYIIRT